MATIRNVSRRDFLKVGAVAGGGLVLGVELPGRRLWAAPAAGSAQLNAFVGIGTDNIITIWVQQSEMGQGVRTALPMLVAEELDVDWGKVRIVQADGHQSKYGNQMTGGSAAVSTSWEPLRKAGAAGRQMLVAAAASAWGVSPEECDASQGQVIHRATARRASYGELAARAAELPVPDDPPLKDPSAFRLLGKATRRTDSPSKVDGSAEFGIDVRVPNMKFATAVRSPVFGGTLKRYDAAKAKAVPGVRTVASLPATKIKFNGTLGMEQTVAVEDRVLVVADNTWAAFTGAQALDIQWSDASRISSADISKQFARLCTSPGVVARNDGDAAGKLDDCAKRVDATYEVPYLAHATMEPMNCTADVRADRCEIWAPTQDPQGAQLAVAKLTGLPVEQVIVHVTLLGGGFGRRAEQDFVFDAVQASQEIGAPVQVVWTREEDVQHDYFRPATYNQFSGGLDAEGNPVVWKHRIVGPSIFERFFGVTLPDGLDPSSVEGAANMPYDVANVHVDYCKGDVDVPTGWWRSVGSSQNGFITESFVDELAHAAGVDPFEFRRRRLSHHPRHKRVLELAARKALWGERLPKGRARGIAVVESFGSYVAQVAEVSLENDQVRVHRVTCAVDCGMIVNPNTIEAQMEGAIVYGLTAALKGEIVLENGRVKQSNFHDYQMLRMNEMPKVDVHIVQSTESPSGVGEPGTPPIAPAVANAVFALTGKRIRKLPLRLEALGG